MVNHSHATFAKQSNDSVLVKLLANPLDADVAKAEFRDRMHLARDRWCLVGQWRALCSYRSPRQVVGLADAIVRILQSGVAPVRFRFVVFAMSVDGTARIVGHSIRFSAASSRVHRLCGIFGGVRRLGGHRRCDVRGEGEKAGWIGGVTQSYRAKAIQAIRIMVRPAMSAESHAVIVASKFPSEA